MPLESWELKYCLDNDKTRFAWADTNNGKGVVWWMKDEFGNEAWYDFKNVQFLRFAISSVNLNGSHPNVGMYGTTHGFVETDTSDDLWCYTFNGIDYSDIGLQECYDFSALHMCFTDDAISSFQQTYSASIHGMRRLNSCSDNVVGSLKSDFNGLFLWQTLYLPNNVFHCALDNFPMGQEEQPLLRIGSCNNNILGEGCQNNTFGKSSVGNVLGQRSKDNLFGDGCHANVLGADVHDIVAGQECYGNTFGDGCQDILLGDSNCYLNEFGPKCHDIYLGDSCYCNKFGIECSDIIYGSMCQMNSVGDECNTIVFGQYNCENTIGTFCTYIYFGNYCSDNDIGSHDTYVVFGYPTGGTTEGSIYPKSHYRNITVDTGCGYVGLDCASTLSAASMYQNVHVHSGILGTENNFKHIQDSNVNQSFLTEYKPQNSLTITV